MGGAPLKDNVTIPSSNGAVISVRDHGIGISPAVLPLYTLTGGQSRASISAP
jgi:hypothetical protein